MLGTCGVCRFGKINPQDLTKRFCRGLPPYPIALPTPKGIAVQMIQPIVSVGDEACSLFKPNIIGGDNAAMGSEGH